jgi:cysteine sulfinate desulfinase/cysteine desulfurase-like protein
MANQSAIKLHTQPGEQLICDKYAHVYNYEGGGVSFNSGVSCKLVDGHRGMMSAEQVEAAINPPDFYHSPLTTLVCIENTTNKGGGACWDFEELRKIKEVCVSHGLAYHLDGARIWNALVAKNESPEQYGKLFDTISICFSKGLGCPVGSVLVGSKVMMDKALRVRKILGGGMRQAGYLAAAAVYALDHNIQRLAEDHQKAIEILTEHEKELYKVAGALLERETLNGKEIKILLSGGILDKVIKKEKKTDSGDKSSFKDQSKTGETPDEKNYLTENTKRVEKPQFSKEGKTILPPGRKKQAKGKPQTRIINAIVFHFYYNSVKVL